MLPFYTSWLTSSDYGSVDLVTTYSGLTLGIVSCCIFDAIFLFPKDRPQEEQSRYFSSGLFFWLLSILILCGVSATIGALSNTFHWHGFVIDYIWFIVMLVSANYIQIIIQQFLRSIDKMMLFSLTGIVQTASSVIFAFILIPQNGISGYIYTLILSYIISSTFAIIFGKLYKYISISGIKFECMRDMLHYTIPMIPNGIMLFMMNSLNRPLIENWLGLASVGIFAVACKFPNLLNTFYLLFQNAWLISVVEEAGKESYIKFYNNMLKIVVAIQSILAVGLSFCSKWIIRLMTTEEYYSAWRYIPVITVGIIFMNIASFVGSNFAVTRESKYYFYSTLWSGIVSVVLNLAFIPVFGLWGACWSMIISQAICAIIRIKYSWKTVRITEQKFYFYNTVFLTFGLTIPLFIESSISLTLSGILLIIFYYYINRRFISEISKLITTIL